MIKYLQTWDAGERFARLFWADNPLAFSLASWWVFLKSSTIFSNLSGSGCTD